MNRISIVLLCFLFINIFSCQKNKSVQVEYDDPKSIESVQKDLFRIKEKGLFGFIDIDGDYIISPRYSYASDFCKGVAKVSLPEQKGYSYIDCTGKEVYINKNDYQFAAKFENTVYENEPYLKLATENIPEGYVQYDYLGNDMFYIVRNDEHIYNADMLVGAVISKEGKFVIHPTESLGIRPFERGMALIQISGRGFDGYLRNDGKIFMSNDYKDYLEENRFIE